MFHTSFPKTGTKTTYHLSTISADIFGSAAAFAAFAARSEKSSATGMWSTPGSNNAWKYLLSKWHWGVSCENHSQLNIKTMTLTWQFKWNEMTRYLCVGLVWRYENGGLVGVARCKPVWIVMLRKWAAVQGGEKNNVLSAHRMLHKHNRLHHG